MINVETALALFKDADLLEKEMGIGNDLWETQIGPNLKLLEHLDFALLTYANEVDYPISGMLTSAGKKRRTQLSKTRTGQTAITAGDQDVILRHLVENYRLGTLTYIEVDEPIHGFAGDELFAVLQHFGNLDLIGFEGYDTIDHQTVGLQVKVKAHEFLHQGGFYGKYELFQKTVMKLLWEVEKLERDDATDNNKFRGFKRNIQEYVSLIANLATAVDSGTKMFE